VVELSGDDFALDGESVDESRWTHTAQMPLDVSVVVPAKKELPISGREPEPAKSDSGSQATGAIESRELKS
jgi:hypothetical protein